MIRSVIKKDPKKGSFAIEIIWSIGDRRRRDVDNIIKPILDALNGLVYYDDSQVMEVSCKKIHSINNSLNINIKEIP